MSRHRFLLVACLISCCGLTSATANVPSGLTGLWRFQSLDPVTGRATMAATIGAPMVSSDPNNSGWFTAPSIQIGTSANPFLWQDSGVAQERAWDYLTATHGISPNGGGSYVNEYTLLLDYQQTSGLSTWNSLYQTAWDPHGDDGDLWSDGAGGGAASHIGVGAAGYSTLTYDVSKWNRIVLSVDNANFFRVYVNGQLFLDAPGQGTDGRFSLNSNVHLFADNDWEDQWGLVGTVMTWDHALTSAEVAAMGGWDHAVSAFPTPLIIPEPASLLLVLGLSGGLALCRRK